MSEDPTPKSRSTGTAADEPEAAPPPESEGPAESARSTTPATQPTPFPLHTFAPPVQGVPEDMVTLRRKVLVTRVSGGLGQLIAERLLDDADEYQVCGVDRRPLREPTLEDRLELHRLELTQNRTEDVFRRGDIDTVVHVAFAGDLRLPMPKRYQRNVVGTMRLLEWCSRHGVRNVVIVSTATVYGANQANPTLITEDFPTLAGQYASSLRDRVEADQFAVAWMWKHPEVRTVILRPVHIVGPTVHSEFQFYLRHKLAFVLLGFDPMVQLVHERDVVRAVRTAVSGSAKGVFNIPGPSALPLREVLRHVGSEPLPVPHIGSRAFMRLLSAVGLMPFKPEHLSFVRFPLVVSGARARTVLGYEPSVSLKATLRSVSQAH